MAAARLSSLDKTVWCFTRPMADPNRPRRPSWNIVLIFLTGKALAHRRFECDGPTGWFYGGSRKLPEHSVVAAGSVGLGAVNEGGRKTVCSWCRCRRGKIVSSHPSAQINIR